MSLEAETHLRFFSYLLEDPLTVRPCAFFLNGAGDAGTFFVGDSFALQVTQVLAKVHAILVNFLRNLNP